MFEIVERILAALIILALLTLLIILAFPVSAPTPGPARTSIEPKPVADAKDGEPRVTEVKSPPPPQRNLDQKTTTEQKPTMESGKIDEDKLPEQSKPVVVAPRRPTPNQQAKTDKDRIEEARIDESRENRRAETLRRDPYPPRRRARSVERYCEDDSCGCEERPPRVVERRRYAERGSRPYWAKQHQPYWAGDPVPPGACPD